MDIEFCQMAVFASVDIIMFFILHFVNVVCHIDCFVYVETSLHPSDKSHLILVYDLLMCC